MSQHRLIVLVSGWTKTDAAWYLLQKRFKEMGYDVIRASYPYRGFAPIQYSARSVARIVEAVAPHYDHVTIVGHSMGGLVGRYVVQRLPQSQHIDAYVSIATPHRGSRLARLGSWFSKSAAQMDCDSQFLKRLNAQPWPADVPALAISGGWEDVVWPRSSCAFEDGECVTIPFANHISLLFDPRTFWEIWSWLTFTVFGEPGPLEDEGMITKVKLA